MSERAAAVAGGRMPRPARRLHDVLDIALLAGLGWEPHSATFAPDRHHRLLGYRLCRVAGCGLEAWSPSGLCGGCLARFEKEGKGGPRGVLPEGPRAEEPLTGPSLPGLPPPRLRAPGDDERPVRELRRAQAAPPPERVRRRER